jgi:hypothetical protein
MKNFKSILEKEDEENWEEFTIRESKERRGRKFRKREMDHRHLDRDNRRFHSRQEI